MNRLIAMVVAAAAAGCSCFVKHGDVTPNAPDNVRFLCVGMERSARFGACPGCEFDAMRITALMKTKYGYRGDTLVSGQAAKSEVVRLLSEGVESTPEDGMFLFFYSGHGGQEALGGQEPDGSDRMDEYLCLYDSHMLDDEIWDIVSRCKGRVFLYFDACHSATMYRSVRSDKALLMKGRGVASAMEGADLVRSTGFTFRPERYLTASAMGAPVRRSMPRILCWSGCKEAEYSYGSVRGGELTTAVVSKWNKGMSYGSLWSAASKAVKKAQPTQNPVRTCVGNFDEGVEAFK